MDGGADDGVEEGDGGEVVVGADVVGVVDRGTGEPWVDEQAVVTSTARAAAGRRTERNHTGPTLAGGARRVRGTATVRWTTPAVRRRSEFGHHREVTLRIVGIGGSVDPDSQSERALRAVLASATTQGATTRLFSGPDLEFPAYHSNAPTPEAAAEYLDVVRTADAVVISSPGYHGTVSGLVKNALDYLEALRTDKRPYLDGRPVGLIAVARGWQASMGTLTTLRQITHALRGWPTPLGLTVNSATSRFDEDCFADDESVRAGVEVLASQLVGPRR